MNDNLLRISDVCRIVPLSRPTIYRRIRAGLFPSPIKDGRCSFWQEGEVRAYAANLVQQQRAGNPACPPMSA